MKFPKISVIIPCKNAGNTLQTTLDSIRSQCYENLECIVMDGLSTDNTVEIIRNNKDIISFYVSQEDRSPSDACNKAINMCTGDVVGFLYADDFLESDALSQIASAVTNNPEYLVYSYGLSIQHLISKKIILESYNKKNINLCLNNVLFKHVLNHFYKKEIFTSYGKFEDLYYDDSIFYSNDREFMIRLCLKGVKNFVIDKILYRMTTHKDSNTGNRLNVVKIRYEHIGIADFYLKDSSLSAYKKIKLLDFKVHNLSLLFAYYCLNLDLNNIFIIFKKGYHLKKYMWFFDIFICPASEVLYRCSVRKWI